MIGTRLSSGSIFEEKVGYSRAVIVPDPGGDWVFVSGTTGYDYATGAIDPDVGVQTQQCFANIAHALEQAGTSLENLITVRIMLTDAGDFEAVAPIVKRHCDHARPTNTTVVTGLIDPAMRIEIEVSARKAP